MFICALCDTEVLYRNQIHEHHIVSKELGGSNKKFNRIFLCPNCHFKVFIPESKIGLHSIKKDNSIIIKGWLQSTEGKVLNYIDESGLEQFKSVRI